MVKSQSSPHYDIDRLAKEIADGLFGNESAMGVMLLEVQWETVLGLAADAVDAAGAIGAFPGFGLICKGLSSLIRYQASNIGKTVQESEVDQLIRALNSQVNRIVQGIDQTTTEITRRSFMELQKSTSAVWVTLTKLLRRPIEPLLKDFLDEREKNKPDVTLEDVRSFVVDHSLLDNVVQSSLHSHKIFEAWTIMIQNVCNQLVLSEMMYLEIGEPKDKMSRADKQNQLKEMLEKVKVIYDMVDRQKSEIAENYLTAEKSVQQRAEEICQKYQNDTNERVVSELKILMQDYNWFEHAMYCCGPNVDDGQVFQDKRRRFATYFKNKVLRFVAHGCEIHIAQITDSNKSKDLCARYIRDQYEKGDERYIDDMGATHDALHQQFGRASLCQSMCDQLKDHISNIMDVNAVMVVGLTYYNSVVARWDALWNVRNTRKEFWACGHIPQAAVASTDDQFKIHTIRYFNNKAKGSVIFPGQFAGYCIQVLIVY